MHRRRMGMVLGSLLMAASRVLGQVQPPVDYLNITGSQARTWTEGASQVVLLHGPVVIDMENVHLTAESAVIWLTPTGNGLLQQQQADIALIGQASATQDSVVRTGSALFVTAVVRGDIRVEAQDRLNLNLSGSPIYKVAEQLRSGARPAPAPPAPPSTQPSTGGRAIMVMQPAAFEFTHIQTVQTPEHKVAAVLSGKVLILYRGPNNQSLEFQADRAVVFTTLASLGQITQGNRVRKIQQNVQAVYLEGDARIDYTPPKGKGAEQRLLAHRLYYDIPTDRAILTDVVLHTDDPKSQIPVTVRAETVRQLAHGEYSTDHVMLSTSSFATPSMAIAAQRAYVHQLPTDQATDETNTYFKASGVKMTMWGIPIFYFPAAAGTVNQNLIPLRQLTFGKSDYFGFHVKTTWGLFESLGEVPPKNLDMAYHLDYYDTRGPAGGLDADYTGGFITQTTKQAWDFQGSLKSYFVGDTGIDQFGGWRTPVNSEETFDQPLRGQILWEHQYFLPEDWQVQLRGGWASDANFLEEWDPQDFYHNNPHDLSLYAKHQTNSDALTLLVEAQPNNFVTTSDMVPNQFEIRRLPELTYQEIGQSVFNDQFTFFSQNSLSALSFNRSGATLAEQGYPVYLSPGLPSLGIAGASGPPDVPESTNYRGDFRQELDYPFSAGEFKVVPYVVGRYTGYTDSLTGNPQNRALMATGLRTTTAFWAVDDTAHSTAFDINRIRHVIEPELNLFASAANTDRDNLYIYDQDVDAINAISGGQLALRQTWQTKRGGPGNWRSVDFLTLDVEANGFTNTPPKEQLDPVNPTYNIDSWRGLYFYSEPEASIPRNSVNAQSTWRVSDQFVVLADEEWNADSQVLATASVGVAVKHDPRVTYFIGTRYIAPLHSNITTVAATYDISMKYTIAATQSFNFAANQDVNSTFILVRKFDTFVASIQIFYDATMDESGVSFNLYPNGIAGGFTTSQLGGVFGGSPR